MKSITVKACEDGTAQAMVRERKDYDGKLVESITDFYKYYQEKNKDKIKQED